MAPHQSLTLGALLRQLRERQGLSQEELAERAGQGLSVSTISNIERDRTRPYRHTLEALGTALNLDPTERAVLLRARGATPRVTADRAASPRGPSTLVPPLTRLIGRELERAVIAQLLPRDDVRVHLGAHEPTSSAGDSDLLAHLSTLVDHSLIRADESAGRQPRFGMLETIREYALERLTASGEEEVVYSRHAAYYLALAEEAEPEIRRPDQVTWLERLDREHDNLRAALTWTLEAGERDLGLRLAAALWWFWRVRGYLAEGQRWAEAMLAGAAGAPELLRVRVMITAACFAHQRTDVDRALALFHESLAICRRRGYAPERAAALFGLGSILSRQGDCAAAEARYREILALAREGGDEWEAAGDDVFEAAWAGGSAMSLEEAIAYALQGSLD